MLLSRDTEELIEDISKELKIPKSLVKKIVAHFYGNLRQNLSNPEFNEILVQFLGTFKVNQGALKHMLRYRVSINSDEELKEKFLNLIKRDNNESKVEKPESSDGKCTGDE